MNSLKKCPMCRTEIDYIEDVNEMRESNDVEAEVQLNEMSLKESSKIKTLVDLIRSKTEKGEKVIVVSQWVSMLEIAQEITSINFPDMKSVCLKGDISMAKRTQIIDEFQRDSSIQICYISLMSSAEGINLTSANNMILLDTWWNNSKMIQVCDRIHRIGQMNNVNIYRLRIGGCNSIEERINKLVLRKDNLKNIVMNKWNSDNPDNFDKILSSSVKLLG
jgi:SNF2 family DNA or RNA helicase